MTRFLLKLIPALVAAFAALNVATRAIGTLQPPNPALAGFIEGCEDKPQPCWYGIVPGISTWEEGEITLSHFSYEQSYEAWISPDGYAAVYEFSKNLPCRAVYLVMDRLEYSKTNSIDRVEFDECSDLLFGDIVERFGEPETFYAKRWSFWGKRVLAEIGLARESSTACLDISPRSSISKFSIANFPQSTELTASNQLYWHGFLPYEKYVNQYGFPSCDILPFLP
ncbi:MAG: hypothetical protein HZC41_00490 [Chloroflexi bacterium]|nr:hypothetical protein [Chloroflexota bacterium]